MRALDLFCGAGGATRGLQEAGYHVTGVDLVRSPRYCGDAFIQADALAVPLDGYDLIWASPPCQGYSDLRTMHKRERPMLVEAVRERLQASGVPYIIENVVGAPLESPVMLCGTMFGLKVFRHRIFESNCLLLSPGHLPHDGSTGSHRWPYTDRRGGYVQVTGTGGNFSLAEGSAAMGIHWMNKYELSQAIPPAYSRFLAQQVNHAR